MERLRRQGGKIVQATEAYVGRLGTLLNPEPGSAD